MIIVQQQPSAGWTVFTASADTRTIYVDPLASDNSGDGLSHATRKKTLMGVDGAWALLRDGYPDWLLILNGSDIPDGDYPGSVTLNGRSDTEPMLIGNYYSTGITAGNPRGFGTGPRPRFNVTGVGSPSAFDIGDGYGNYLAFDGIEA